MLKFHKPVFWSITPAEMIAWVLFNSCFTLVFFSIMVHTGFVFKFYSTPLLPISPLLVEALIDFSGKAILLLPGWLFFFKTRRHMSATQIIIAHLAGLPLFVITWNVLGNYLSVVLGTAGPSDRSAPWFIFFFPAVYYLVQFGIFHTYSFWLRNQKLEMHSKELRNLALQNELNTLRSQIQPHFLFNTLNSISASVSPEQEHTRELISKLADIFRYSLKSTQAKLVNLNDELAFVTTLLELEQERFGDRLQYEILVKNDIVSTRIPPMILQPIVENAIKHGIAPNVEGGYISIEIFADDKYTNVHIYNTGCPYKPDTSSLFLAPGIGLRNTRDRLQLMQYNFDVVKNDNHHLTFQLQLPKTTLA